LEQKTRDESSIGIRRLETERNRTESEREMRMEREGGREAAVLLLECYWLFWVLPGISRRGNDGMMIRRRRDQRTKTKAN
jgi:hypothetical protein